MSSSAVPVSRIRWRRGRVTATGRSGRDTLELTVEVPGDGEVRALAYRSLVGSPEIGDDVLLNTTALAQGLGTGGVALVVAVPDRLPPDPEGAGHLVKARYTPLQVSVQGVDEQDTEHHALMVEADDLDGMPVVVADLHSALPAVLIGMLATDPDLQGRLRHDRRRRAAGRLLADAGRARALAGRGGHRRAGLGRRPGGRHAAHRAARGPARAAGGPGGRHAGSGQPGHGNAVGLLRCGRGRGVQRGHRAGR